MRILKGIRQFYRRNYEVRPELIETRLGGILYLPIALVL
jgi:hypothetical protein